jgi:LPXTG-motif cell wall-anchored protein
MRSIVAPVGLAMLLALAVGGPASAATSSVSIVDFAFSPATITIAPGDSVLWANNGNTQHTSSSDLGSGETWDSGTLNPGGTFSHTFSNAGSFPYHCNFHPTTMTGTVIVQAGGGGAGGGLPSTGIGDSAVPFVWIGLLFLVSGGAVLYVMRRRRRA